MHLIDPKTCYISMTQKRSFFPFLSHLLILGQKMKGSTTQSLKPETYFKDTDRKVDFMMIQDDDVKQSYCHVLVR